MQYTDNLHLVKPQEDDDVSIAALNENADTLATAVNNYSETEHIVGSWVDGSVLYEKTYHTQVTADGTDDNTGHHIDISGENVDICASLEVIGNADTVAGKGSVSGTMPDTQGIGVYRLGDTLYLNTALNAIFYPAEVYVTMRYTKVLS